MSVFKKKNLFFRPKEDIPWGMFKYSKTKGISRKGLKKKGQKNIVRTKISQQKMLIKYLQYSLISLTSMF